VTAIAVNILPQANKIHEDMPADVAGSLNQRKSKQFHWNDQCESLGNLSSSSSSSKNETPVPVWKGR